MEKPLGTMKDKNYTKQWEDWITFQIQINDFETFGDCLKYLISLSDGRVNSRVVKRIYEEINILK